MHMVELGIFFQSNPRYPKWNGFLGDHGIFTGGNVARLKQLTKTIFTAIPSLLLQRKRKNHSAFNMMLLYVGKSGIIVPRDVVRVRASRHPRSQCTTSPLRRPPPKSPAWQHVRPILKGLLASMGSNKTKLLPRGRGSQLPNGALAIDCFLVA